MSDPSPPAPDRGEVGNPTLSRRGLFAGGLAGAAALYGLSSGGAAARSLSPAVRSALAAGTVSFGSNGSDPVPKKAYANVFKAFTKKTGISVKVNTVDHNTFQEQINTYLQGQPQDVFTWFAGYRMQFFASKGLLSPIDDVWAPLKSQFASAYQNASKGADGHYYFVPIYAYPWAVHYRKSVWRQHGYTVPKTWDQFVALAKKMQADGLTPIAFTRQGRLARDGHLRHHQHAAERLRLPRPPDGGEGPLGRAAGEAGVQHVARDPAVHLRRRARAHLAGGCAAARQQGGRHVHARHLRGPAVHGCRPEGHRLLRLSHDQPEVGSGLDRCPHRRVLHGPEGEQLEGGEGPALVPRDRDGREHLPRLRPERRGGEQEHQQVAVHGTPEEVSAADRARRSTSRSTSTATPGPTSPRR